MASSHPRAAVINPQTDTLFIHIKPNPTVVPQIKALLIQPPSPVFVPSTRSSQVFVDSYASFHPVVLGQIEN